MSESQKVLEMEPVELRVEPQMRWRMSPTIGKLAEALAKAQAKFDKVLKDSQNPAYHSKYADLATVLDATRPHLAAEGLAIMQLPQARWGVEDAKEVILTTMLAHGSGEWITSDLTLPAMMRERFDAQSCGSAITYARRYALAAMVGVAQDDDDGNKAGGIGSKEEAAKVAKRKIQEATGAAPNEPITIVAYKEGQLAITGNSLALLRADLTEEEKTTIRLKWSGGDRTWLLVEADGNTFAALAEKHGYKVVWSA